MYCIQCGVKLADTEKRCPLCGTVPFHPDIPREKGTPLYPPDRYPRQQVSRKGVLGVVTILLMIPMLITLICDLGINARITWSGYVIGALGLGYVAARCGFADPIRRFLCPAIFWPWGRMCCTST